VSKGAPLQGIVNPKKLSADENISICAQCHVGLTKFSDPSPNDLLVANQVLALKNSECFIQSGKALTCTTCHNPHQDAPEDNEASVKACLACHSTVAKPHAAICPVSARSACLGCHMPSAKLGSLQFVDHQIRVHPEQGLPPLKKNEELRSQVRPLREFLRIIVTNNRGQAENATQRLTNGEAFSKVARDVSSATALAGGYMGPKWLSELDPSVAAVAATLAYGQTTGIIGVGERWMIVQRMPRDFKWQAGQLQEQAEALLTRGDSLAAIEKSQQALMIYPHFLRALTFLARTLGETGSPQRAADVLRIATVLYPNDAGAEFDLGRVLGRLGRQTEATEAYRHAIALDPELLPAYAYLGSALYTNEDLQSAIDVFRDGLQVDPLSAELYYRLSLALARQGNEPAAKRAAALATQSTLTLSSGHKNKPDAGQALCVTHTAKPSPGSPV
jgi:tetratricopeptide (TPR) repeat protein